ncbi:hypothetical protein AB0I91_07770 [Actinosynnema sp. NPDC049800]
MELTARLAPVVFAELYQELQSSCATQMADRLADIDRDLDWLSLTIQRYEALWAYRLTLPDPQERYQPLDADHAALAAWIAAGLRGYGPSNEINQAVQQAVRDRTASDPPELVRDHSRVALVAWSLGQVVGDYDRSLPVVFCEPLADRSVQLAYEGLVQHVVGLPEVDEWPEMLGSAVLWRACGLADGLRPQKGGRSNLEASVNELIAGMRRYVSSTVLLQWAKEWPEYTKVRNGFTHVAGENGAYSFADVASRMRNRSEVAPALTSATTFVGHSLAEELLDSPLARWRAVVDNLEWELQAYEDFAPGGSDSWTSPHSG